MDERDRKHRSAANAVGGSTARACDGCLRRRARWYCGADDAFLCQACDSSVHSANSLARRHQRLRLHTASSFSYSPSPTPPPISWRKRKARTPRAHHQPNSVKPPEPLVPDLEKEEEEQLEMQLMCCVPVLDPLFNDFSSATLEAKPISGYGLDAGPGGPSIEMDMENLDVECLLGVGLDDVHESSLYIDGFTAADEEDLSRIKMEFDYDAMGDEMELCHEAQGVVDVAVEERKERELGEGAVKKMGLRLDYDAVIDACSRSGCSPWSGGDRPQLDSNGYLPSLTGLSEAGGASWSRGRWGASGGEEREARVTRYREKRRTRLFSKKIRYEVRKLNAEKRPRMKGRFVKRTTTLSATGPGQANYGQY